MTMNAVAVLSEEALDTHFIGGWVGLIAGLDSGQETERSLPMTVIAP
jgi:hypothetical protein